MTVAIVHDYLTQRGGAERVVLSMMKAFPGAPVHTSFFHPEGTFPEFGSADVRISQLDRIGLLRRNHRLAIPLLAPAFSSRRVDADVVLCSSSGWAHGVRTTGRKIVYCYSPARWLYQGDRYMGAGRGLQKGALAVMRPPLVRWDRRQALTANRYVTLSSVVRDRIRAAYGIDAEVLPPPHTVDPGGPMCERPDIDAGYFLCIARLLPYKNVDAVIAAFQELPDQRLVVVGTGPERDRLAGSAGGNVSMLGSVTDEELRWLYSSCAAVVSASYEDYGLTPVEAAAFGKPAVVLRGGGFLDTVMEGQTGLFFDHPEPRHIASAIRSLLRGAWPAQSLKDHAARFDETHFIRRLREVVDER